MTSFTYRSPELGFSVAVPAGWFVDESMGHVVRFGIAGPVPHLAVEAREDEVAATEGSPGELLDVEVGQRRGMPDFQLLNRTSQIAWGPTFAPSESALMSTRWPPGSGQSGRILMVLVSIVGHGQAFTIMGVSSDDRWESDFPIIRPSLASFALEGESNEPSMLIWDEYRPLLPVIFGLSPRSELAPEECAVLAAKILDMPMPTANGRPLSLSARLRALRARSGG